MSNEPFSLAVVVVGGGVSGFTPFTAWGASWPPGAAELILVNPTDSRCCRT